MKNKIIVIEGTDCSGKQTQTQLLKQTLLDKGYRAFSFDFPNYESPTGKIIGGPYLGKKELGDSYFPETAPNVDALTSSLFYATDRFYNFPKIKEKMEEGYLIILDRYTYSSMAHQGGKLTTVEERNDFYEWIEKLEFEMLKLPIPSIRLFLHMPFEAEIILRQKKMDLDDNEKNNNHLIQAEKAYLEIAKKYQFHTIECLKDKQTCTIKSKDEIAQEIWNFVQTHIQKEEE